MPIYTSYYSAPTIKGVPIAISLSVPPNCKHKRLQIFAPTKKILQHWKQSSKDETAWTDYKTQYKGLMRERWSEVKQWLNSLNPEENSTLLCYEKNGYCHRHLVGAIVKQNRPDCWGGEINFTEEEHTSSFATISDKKTWKPSIGAKMFFNEEPFPERVVTVMRYCEWDDTRVFVKGNSIDGCVKLSSLSLKSVVLAEEEFSPPPGWGHPENFSQLVTGTPAYAFLEGNKKWLYGSIQELWKPNGVQVSYLTVQSANQKIKIYGRSQIIIKLDN